MHRILRNAALAAALCGAATAHATTVMPTLDGQWYTFDVDDVSAISGDLEWIDFADGSPLSFGFSSSQRTRVTVVDAGFAGDRFVVTNNGVTLGETLAVADSFPDSIGLDFDAALASGAFSHRTFLLGGGSHLITGLLSRSALDDAGSPINATVGAVRFTSVDAPETGIAAMGIVGLLLAVRRRRHAAS